MNFLIRHFYPDIWEMEEVKISPDWESYSKGEILNEALVEKKILPLVRSLNRPDIGVKTIASCQGHLFSQRHLPYVYFQCPISIASQLAEALHRLSILESGTHFHWHLKPVFNGDFEICFHLNLGTFKIKKSGLFHYRKYWRDPLQEDFSILTDLCNQFFDNKDKVIPCLCPDRVVS